MKNEKTPKVGVGSLIFRDDKILLGKRLSKLGEKTWGVVGGHLKFGETPEQAVVREVKEETGLEVISTKLICVSNIVSYDKHYLDLEFKVEVAEGEPQLMEPDKFETWDWFDLNNLPKPLFKAAELAIESYKTGKIYNS